MKKLLLATALALACHAGFAAEPWQDAAVKAAAKFEEDFWNSQCDLDKLPSMYGEHFQYVHDDIGVTSGKTEMMKLMRGICSIPGIKIRREAIAGTVHYYPLRDIRWNKNEAIGVVVSGEHQFFDSENGGPEVARSRGHFTHTLITKDGHWVVSQIMDYGNLIL
jgi:hypothetical protein